MQCIHLGKLKGVWNVGGVEHRLHVCNNEYRECIPQPGHPTGHSCVGCPQFSQVLPTVDVIVTSHNYGRFLDEALDSVDQQEQAVLRRVIVVDDASEPGDETKAICERRGVEYLRTEFHSPHLARGAGFKLCESPLVQFLDADNTLPGDYLSEAARLFASDHRLAIAYPDLQEFGDSNKLRRMPEFDPAGMERINCIDTGAVWLREALEQAVDFERDPAGLEDWRMARAVMRAGTWRARKLPIPLNYRKHESQRLNSFSDKPYFVWAGLADETVTIFTTFSGRIQKSPELWERRKQWLRDQTWPNVRLVVVNTSHEPLPDGWNEGLPDIPISFYSHPVGKPGLEDIDRRDAKVERAVSTAVAAIYNRMWQETQTEFVLILEDDVFPERLDTIREMMASFDQNTCAVTGRYRQRYFPYILTVWSQLAPNGRPITRIHGPHAGIQDAQGAGFGCLLVRRSQMAHEPILANSELGPYYDVNLFKSLADAGRKIRINWGVGCDHVGQRMPPPDDDPETKLTIVLTTINRPTLRRTLDSIKRQMRGMDEVWLVSDGPVSGSLRNVWYSVNVFGRLIEMADGPHQDWGHTPRNRVLPTVPNGYVLNIDDDDALAPGALDHLRQAIKANSGDLFMMQMRRPDGSIIPDGNELRPGNVGTPMLIFPAGRALGTFEPRYGGDFDFIAGTVAANSDRALHWLPFPIIDIRPPIATAQARPLASPAQQPEAFRPCAHLGPVIRTDKCEICGTVIGKGKPVEVRACEVFRECSASRYRQLKQPHICNMACKGFEARSLVQLTLP